MYVYVRLCVRVCFHAYFYANPCIYTVYTTNYSQVFQHLSVCMMPYIYMYTFTCTHTHARTHVRVNIFSFFEILKFTNLVELHINL